MLLHGSALGGLVQQLLQLPQQVRHCCLSLAVRCLQRGGATLEQMHLGLTRSNRPCESLQGRNPDFRGGPFLQDALTSVFMTSRCFVSEVPMKPGWGHDPHSLGWVLLC